MMAAYLKHIPHAREVRAKLMTCTRLAEIEDVLGSLLRALERDGAPGTSEGPTAGGSATGSTSVGGLSSQQ
jgi:hypothetical protein